jgi:hypothetical protein
MRLAAALLLASAALIGCAGTGTSRMTTDFSKSARCGVVAFVNQQATMNFVALMIVANETRTVAVDNAALEALIEDSIVTGLRPTLGARVARVEISGRAELRDALTMNLGTGRADPERPERWKATLSRLREQAQAQRFDCLIVISPENVYSSESHPRIAAGLGFIVRGQAFTYFAGQYSIVSLRDNELIAAGRLLQEPNANFLTRTAPSMVWIGPVAVTEFVKDFRTDPRLNDRTVEVFKGQAPGIAPVIAANVVDAFATIPPR